MKVNTFKHLHKNHDDKADKAGNTVQKQVNDTFMKLVANVGALSGCLRDDENNHDNYDLAEKLENIVQCAFCLAGEYGIELNNCFGALKFSDSAEKFDEMMGIAKDRVMHTKVKGDYQVVVIQYANGDEYDSFCLSKEEIVTGEKIFIKMKETGNNVIKRILCMWKSGEIDVPSYLFCSLLCMLNEKNNEAEILIKENNVNVVKKIEKIMEC